MSIEILLPVHKNTNPKKHFFLFIFLLYSLLISFVFTFHKALRIKNTINKDRRFYEEKRNKKRSNKFQASEYRIYSDYWYQDFFPFTSLHDLFNFEINLFHSVCLMFCLCVVFLKTNYFLLLTFVMPYFV